MENETNIGLVMPKVLYPDGRLQPLCKLLPTPKTLFMRRFLRFLSTRLERENYKYELRGTGYDNIVEAPFLSGCFMFLRTEVLKEVGLFDERFFLYTEDTDLSRRIHRRARTVFFPEVTIYHHHERGSYKSIWLLMQNIRSAIRYFNKWGWTTDEERENFNARALQKACMNL
jgi:GT2 family glycosyltransferase